MNQPVNVWSSFALDPRQPANASFRASDADRDVANAVLSTAYAEGRLTASELDERSTVVAQSKTLGALVDPLSDLIAEQPAPAPLVQQPSMRLARRGLVQDRRVCGLTMIAVICWVVWAVSLAGGHPEFPWPIFITLAVGHRRRRLGAASVQ